jgi:hypothetical protein
MGGAWLSVELGADAPNVSRVVIYNRYDCCQDKLGHYEIYVADAAGLAMCKKALCLFSL